MPVTFRGLSRGSKGIVQGPARESGAIEAEAASGQRGAILPLFAILLVVLVGVTGFAVDLGWLYFKSIEVQHGADLAALSGVVYEPSDPAKAHTEALASAKENGFVDGTLGGPDTVLIEDFIDNPSAVEHARQLRATITHQVPTFFMKLFGIDSVDIRRTAVAQYALPLALGSPESYLGTDPSRGLFPGFWVSVHGTWSKKNHGDRFADGCQGETTGPGCPKNPEHRPAVNPGQATASGGYIYGIDMPEGASDLALAIFDGPWYDGGNDHFLTGDEFDAVTTWFMLYGPDPTPLDTTDGNELLCSVKYDPRSPGRSVDVPGWDDTWDDWALVSPQSLIGQLWDDMATSADRQGCVADFDRGQGIYPLRVMVEHDDSQFGYNKFSFRVTTTGPDASIFGLGDMSIFANPGAGGASTDLFLVEVGEEHQGKSLIIELFDVGDITGGSAADKMTLRDGNRAIPDCSWMSDDGEAGGPGPCVISTPDKRFNGELLTITVPIPNDYTCSGLSCWFKIDYQYVGTVNDTTTWAARLPGNPIRLVE